VGNTKDMHRIPFRKPELKRPFWAAEEQNDIEIDFKVI
jgi:hypothetical protein